MSNNNLQSGERLSFFKLFKERGYRILVPIIQRDYAQGRQSSLEVRNVFLDALFDYLKENKTNRDLDFVYGTLIEQKEYTDFIPLDGQQRLTTLFLLHWYLYQISINEELKKLFREALLKNNKSMFTYETRSSSSEFCDSLMLNQIDFSCLLDNSVSKTIENSNWFYSSWKNDPTIQSMLIMLDSIHLRFSNNAHFFERLLDIENPIITFLFLNLKDYRLTDDLYIKMNSRGKPLTSFENFKAKFEQHLETVNINRKFLRSYGDNEKEVSVKEYFSFNIDTIWANLFWNYRDLVGDNNVFDEELKNFIRVILSNQYAMSRENDANFEYLIGTQVARKRIDYSDDISYYKYKDLDAITNTGVLYLIDSFDSLINGNNKIKIFLQEPYQYYFSENLIFEKALKNNFANNQERILFHAYLRFLIVNSSDDEGLDEWMRTIHNLANNTIIDGADEVSRAIKSIEKMLPQSKNIIDYLSSGNHIDFFSAWQVLEERIKADLIIKSTNWKEKIQEFEKSSYFDGQIGFLLEFSGIKAHYLENKNCDWTQSEDENYFKSFVFYGESASRVFENKQKLNENFVWERAVLSKGDYLIEGSSWRKNLLNSERNSRDYSWKRLLRFTDENYNKRKFVKDVFDDLLFDKSNLEESLEKICLQKSNTWRDYLVEVPALIKDCLQGFIRFENESDVRIFSQSQLNHYHTEMYSRYFWCKYLEIPQIDTAPFTKNYFWSKSSEEYPVICFNNFCHNRIYYDLELSCDYSNIDEFGVFQLIFKKSKGETSLENYGDDIRQILLKHGLLWNNDTMFFSREIKDMDLLNKVILEIIEDVRSL